MSISYHRRVGFISCLLALSACASAPTTTAPARKTIEVAMPLTAEKAGARIQAAARAGGHMIASNEGGVITLAPYELPDQRPPIMLTIRVNLVTTDSGTVAVIGGAWSNQALANIQKTEPSASAWSAQGQAEEGGRGYVGKAFKEVQRFAESVRAAR